MCEVIISVKQDYDAVVGDVLAVVTTDDGRTVFRPWEERDLDDNKARNIRLANGDKVMVHLPLSLLEAYALDRNPVPAVYHVKLDCRGRVLDQRFSMPGSNVPVSRFANRGIKVELLEAII